MASTSTTSLSILSAPHLSGLNDAQQAAFVELKQLCEENNALWPPSEAASTRGIEQNHDATLIRYLRARSYNSPSAHQQYTTTTHWRTSLSVNTLYDGAPIPLFESTRRLLPHWCGRIDKQGHPLFVYVLADVDATELVALSRRDPELKSVVLPAEAATVFDMPLCTAAAAMRRRRDHGEGGGREGGETAGSVAAVVDRGVNIIDLEGVSLRQFWGMRGHLQAASRMATAHYPETVERMFIIGAPSYFPVVWNFITKWFDRSTTEKIHIVPKDEVLSTLEKYIDRKDIPARFGGDLQWRFGDAPSLHEEFRPLVGDLVDHWVPGPLRFFDGEDGAEVVAVGTSEDGQKRCEVIAKTISSVDEVLINEKSSPLMDEAAVVISDTS